jgi:hypothetical protein
MATLCSILLLIVLLQAEGVRALVAVAYLLLLLAGVAAVAAALLGYW